MDGLQNLASWNKGADKGRNYCRPQESKPWCEYDINAPTLNDVAKIPDSKLLFVLRIYHLFNLSRHEYESRTSQEINYDMIECPNNLKENRGNV